jgi:hypothetical protein
METNFNDVNDGPGFDEVQVPDTYSTSAEGMKSVAKDDEENDVGSDDMDQGKEEVINVDDESVSQPKTKSNSKAPIFVQMLSSKTCKIKKMLLKVITLFQ